MNASQDPLSGYCMFNAKLHEYQAMYDCKLQDTQALAFSSLTNNNNNK